MSFFDGSEKNQATDIRYEYRSDESLLTIGPKEDNFFYIKPLFGIEYTSDSAVYFLTGFSTKFHNLTSIKIIIIHLSNYEILQFAIEVHLIVLIAVYSFNVSPHEFGETRKL